MLSREEWEARKAKTLSKDEWDRAKRMKALDQSKANIAADSAAYNPTAGVGSGQRFVEGIGAGMTGVGRRAANLALPRALEPQWATEEAIKSKKELDAPLVNTTAGGLGKVAGEIAATLPVVGAVGAAGSLAAGSSMPAIASAGEALAAGSGWGGAASRAVLEGAGQAALTSESGQLGKEMLIGGALGGGLGLVGKTVGKAARAMRPEITAEARQLMQETGSFIPASQALPEGSIGRQINEGLMANLPASGGVIRGQRQAAVDAVRSELIEKSIPKATTNGTIPTAAVFQSGDKMSDVIPNLQKVWDDAYKDVYDYPINGVEIPQEVADMIAARAGSSIKTGGDLTGREALDLSQGIQQLINEMPGGRLERSAKKSLEAVRKSVEDTMESQLPADIAKDYLENKSLYKNFLAVKDAAKKAVGGEFSLRQAERSLAKKGGSARELAQRGTEVLKEFPSRQGLFQTIAASTVPAAAGGYLGWTTADQDASIGEKLARAGTFGAATLGGARMLATPTGQKMLVQYGEKGVLDKYARLLRNLGTVGRAGAVSAASQTQE